MTMRRSILWAIAAVAAAVVAVLISSSATGRLSFSFSVREGAAPVLSADDVQGLARTQFEWMANLAGKGQIPGTAVATAVLGRDLHAVEPDAPIFDPVTLPASATVWVVRADTVFASNRGPTNEVKTWDSGYLIFDATTGTLLGLGMP
jgi:hypothetical protein